MLDSGKAYEALGVKRDASRNEIERRYSILMKKHRLDLSQGEAGTEEQAEFDRITQAYNLLMGYSEPAEQETVSSKPNPVYSKLGLDEKKVGNFLYYYKLHIIIGVVILAVLVFMIVNVATNVNPDFQVAFVGEIDTGATDELSKMIKAEIPDIKVPGIDSAFITKAGDSQIDYAGLMKSTALFAAGDVDVFIMDSVNFQKYAKQGAFISLDFISEQLGADAENKKDAVVKAEEDQKEHLYGLNISGSSALKKAGIKSDEFIIAVPTKCKQQDKAIELIRFLMK